MVQLHKTVILLFMIFIVGYAENVSNDKIIVKALMTTYGIPDSLYDSVATTENGNVVKLTLSPIDGYLKKAATNKPIEIFPKEIGELVHLKVLVVHNVKDIPHGIYKLEKLEKLYLKSNYLKKIPKEISKLKSLKVLDVKSDSLRAISTGIYKLNDLIELTLYGSDNEFIPKGIECLENLYELNIKEFRLADDFFKKEANLKISTFKLYNSKLPSSVKYLVNLKRLNYGELSSHVQGYGHIDEDEFRSVDKIISTSKYEIKTIPESIKELKKLKHLSLTSFHLNELPLFLSQINTLETLFISHIKLDSIPKFIMELNNLKVLTLSYCNINHLPLEIVKLKNIKELNLSSNNITVLPHELLKFTKLKKLNVWDNKICNTIDDEMVQWITTKTGNLNWQEAQKCFEK